MCTRIREHSFRAGSTPSQIRQKAKGTRKASLLTFWWNRPVTAHYHEKDYMDRVGKISVSPVIARKIIEVY
jgi:hypothetical protein